MNETFNASPSLRVPLKAPPLSDIPLKMWHALREHDAFNAAGAMAFQFFLSLIPLLVLAGFVVGHLVRVRGVDPVMEPVLDLLPQAAADLVHRELEGMAGSGSAPVAPLSVIGFLLVASNGTHAMMNVFERAFGAHRRPWWKKRLIASAWLVGVVGSMSLTLWGLSKIDASFHRSSIAPAAGPPSPPQSHEHASDHATEHPVAPHASAHHARSAASITPTPTPVALANTTALPAHPRGAHHFLRHTFGEKAIAFLILLVVTLAALAALYRFAIEHPKGIERRVWPGAAVSIAFWFPVSYLFGAYVSSLGEYVAYYGSLAAVAVVLIWLYLTSLVLLAGAELNAILEGVRGDVRSVVSLDPALKT
ncbi:MAG: YihY/virulence factor BrkB family protein [Polyangiaceae bacterium]